MKKNKFKQILESNPALAKEVAKLLTEELANEVEADVTDLTTPDVPAGSNQNELVPEAPGADNLGIDNTVLADGHEVDEELTAEDPVTPEAINDMIDEIPAEDLEDEVEGLEANVEEDKEKIEELEEVIEEATQLIEMYQRKVVFTESVINKVNARILMEAARVLSNKKSLTEGRK